MTEGLTMRPGGRDRSRGCSAIVPLLLAQIPQSLPRRRGPQGFLLAGRIMVWLGGFDDPTAGRLGYLHGSCPACSSLKG